ncbi:MAG: hypothetical protein JW902_14560 [Syntrophaceae bacterium]|nr:hypothetical protein [Syntrophaceae bacterium]
MASPHVAGALALLASVDKPVDAADVYTLYEQVRTAGNFDWIDDSGDGIKEPLLDVSTFEPGLIPVGAVNNPPVVNITSPTETSFSPGDNIVFSGEASDAEDGTLTDNLIWTSSLSGPIGTGGFFTRSDLSTGTHVITASVTDSSGAIGSDSKTITVAASSGSEIVLDVTTKVKGSKYYAYLAWSGANSTSVDVYRNDEKVTTTANDGAYTDGPLKSISAAAYKVCEAGTSTCSSTINVSW